MKLDNGLQFTIFLSIKVKFCSKKVKNNQLTGYFAIYKSKFSNSEIKAAWFSGNEKHEGRTACVLDKICKQIF